MKSKISLIVLFLTLSCVVLYVDSLVFIVAKIWCQKSENFSLKIEKTHFTRRGVRLEGVEIQKGGLTAHIKTANFSTKFLREFAIDLDLQNLVVKNNACSAEPAKSKKNPFTLHIHTKQGEIVKGEQTIFFDLDAVLHKSSYAIQCSLYHQQRKIFAASACNGFFDFYWMDCPVQELIAALDFRREFKDLQAHGRMDGETHFSFDATGLSFFSGNLKCDDFAIAKNLVSLHMPHFLGEVFFDLKRPMECKGNLQIENGNFHVDANLAQLLHVTQLSADILMDEGQIVHSMIQGKFQGGAFDLQFTQETIAQLFFQIRTKELMAFFPRVHSFYEAFTEDVLTCQATMQKNEEDFYIEGILENQEEKKDQISFGCYLQKKEVEPISLFSWIKKLSAFERIGWIKARALSAKKYLSFFLLNQTPFHFLGEFDFEATFDANSLLFFYKTDQLELKSENISFKIQELKKEQEFPGWHCIDLKTFQHFGFLPFQKAEYRQKEKLHFTDGSGFFLFENKQILGKNLHANSLGLEFSAELEIAIENFDSIDLKITTEKVEGSVASLGNFIAPIKPSLLWQLPFEGELKSSEKGVLFHAHFSPEMEVRVIQTTGSIDAHLISSFGSLNRMQFDFSFDGLQKTCVIENFHTLFESNYFDSSCIQSEKIILSDLPHFFVQGECICQNEKDSTCFRLSSEKRDVISVSSSQGEIKIEWLSPLLKIFCNQKEYSLKTEIEIRKKYCKVEEFFIKHEKWGCLQGSLFYENKNLRAIIDSFAITSPFEFFGKAELFYQFGKPFEIYFKDVVVGKEKLPLSIKTCFYDLEKNHFALSSTIDWEKNAALTLLTSLPEKAKVLLENRDRLSARVNFVFQDGKERWECVLDEQEIPVLDSVLFLHHPTIIKNVEQWEIRSECSFLSEHFFSTFRLHSLKNAELLFHESSEPFQKKNDTIVCLLEKQEKWSLRKIQGHCFDYFFALHSQENTFNGKVSIPLSSFLSHVLHLESAELTGMITLLGTFALTDSLQNSSFEGKILLEDCSLYDTKFSSLESDITIKQGQIAVKNCSIQDRSGKLQLEQANFSWLENRFFLKNLRIEKLFLSELRSPIAKQAQKKKFFRTFRLPHFFLDHLYGSIDDPASLVGWGNFSFAHVSKKNFLNHLLYLPNEITARLGLDFSNFVPVKGDVEFEIKEAKIFLNKFKNMHSEAKRSSFFLADQLPSTIDFHGNLNIFVKMKHHNLLMKLAEFFTLAIKGTVKSPSYTLTNSLNRE